MSGGHLRIRLPHPIGARPRADGRRGRPIGAQRQPGEPTPTYIPPSTTHPPHPPPPPLGPGPETGRTKEVFVERWECFTGLQEEVSDLLCVK